MWRGVLLVDAICWGGWVYQNNGVILPVILPMILPVILPVILLGGVYQNDKVILPFRPNLSKQLIMEHGQVEGVKKRVIKITRTKLC